MHVINWTALDEYKTEYLTVCDRVADLLATQENKEDEILSITDRVDELLDAQDIAFGNEIARAREKRARLREECVELRRERRSLEARRDWLLVQASIVFKD